MIQGRFIRLNLSGSGSTITIHTRSHCSNTIVPLTTHTHTDTGGLDGWYYINCPKEIRIKLDITINSSDSNQIDVDVSDSNNLNLKLTGGDKGLRLHMLETIYPVGSIYINGGVATNPGTIRFWNMDRFGTGRTIVGVDSSDTDFDTVRETGGSKTHTLTMDYQHIHTNYNSGTHTVSTM